MNLIVNNSKVSCNVIHDVVLSTVIQLYPTTSVIVLAEEIEAQNFLYDAILYEHLAIYVASK